MPDTDPAPSAQLLTAEQVAERWQVRTAQVYRLTRAGRLPAVRIGRYYRYRLAALEAFEVEGGVGRAGGHRGATGGPGNQRKPD